MPRGTLGHHFAENVRHCVDEISMEPKPKLSLTNEVKLKEIKSVLYSAQYPYETYINWCKFLDKLSDTA